MNSTPYIPIDYDLMQMLENEKSRTSTRVFYFGEGTNIEEFTGKVTGLTKVDNFEHYMQFESGEKIRIDRIISYNLKPGPAYDEYDSYALQCLTCEGGYNFED